MRRGSRVLQLLPGVLCLCGGLERLGAQSPVFSGVVRGVLLECDAPALSGQFAVRAQSTNQVYRFSFDAKTYVEQDERRISMAAVRKGDTIEVVSDRDEAAAVHYARTVHVIEMRPAPRPPVSQGKVRLYRSAIEFMAPRGNLTFSGVVARLTPDWLVLRTRREGEKTVLLRTDTRYLEEGSLVEARDLKPNTRVFIRAGKNLDDQIEAYQIIWGEILEPVQSR